MDGLSVIEFKDYLNAGAVGVLVLLLMILYRGGYCLGKRLFHETNGLVTQWVKSQQAFVEAVQAQNAATHESIERHTDCVLHLCTVLRRVCRDKIGVAVDDEMDRVETLVRSASEKPHP
jgi:hypothetical protein